MQRLGLGRLYGTELGTVIYDAAKAHLQLDGTFAELKTDALFRQFDNEGKGFLTKDDCCEILRIFLVSLDPTSNEKHVIEQIANQQYGSIQIAVDQELETMWKYSSPLILPNQKTIECLQLDGFEQWLLSMLSNQ